MTLFSFIRRRLSWGLSCCWGLFVIFVGLVFRAPSDAVGSADKNECRILVVRLDGIGDLVLNTPVLRELRKARPNAEITLLIPERGRIVYETCPYVDQLLIIHPNLENRRNPLQSLLSARAYWHTQSNRNFNIALSPRLGLDPFLAFILYFSNAPIRLGYSERFAGNKLNLDRFLTQTIPHAKQQHDTQNSLAVLEALHITPTDSSPEIWLSQSDREFAVKWNQQDTADSRRLVVGIGVGASLPKRIWPPERHAIIASWLVNAYEARIFLLGGANDVKLASRIAKQVGPAAINLAGQTSLREAAALIEICSVLLVHDTGLLHIGSAVGTPTVEISCHPRSGLGTSSNAPERFGPWHVPHRILRPNHPRPPCVDGCIKERQAHCILEIETEEVKEALSELIMERYGWPPNC